MTFGEVAGENVVLPHEFTLTILDWYSQCEINETALGGRLNGDFQREWDFDYLYKIFSDCTHIIKWLSK